jgi:hypothetical protein
MSALRRLMGVKRKCCERHQFDAPDPTRTFENDDHARRCEGQAMPQFGNSGDKIGQTVAVARYIVQRGSFSATSGLFGHNWEAD